MFWADENFIISKEIADEFKSQIKTPLLLVNIFKYVIFIAGVIGSIGFLSYGIHLYRKYKKEDPERAHIIPTTKNTEIIVNNAEE